MHLNCFEPKLAKQVENYNDNVLTEYVIEYILYFCTIFQQKNFKISVKTFKSFSKSVAKYVVEYILCFCVILKKKVSKYVRNT